ncbi:Putative L-lactate dehydrogenase operon regulatory protein [Baekduia alba]|uniref:FadR/GntR family transcriptional regulator n=1 Tax=Baekduia alba TaxID=2997333 RepID=UPI0023412D8E|nr:FadR/GntR family transcriptional regulator [Baekduia alba]WCB96495.1 Putative L-lactate dehydrogenase operon regulatory protein [Baekduia alba]
MSDLFIEIPRTSTPQAIEDQIRGLIVSRQLVAGEALPPERAFAARLGVSRSTLREALRALTEQGIVAARQGSGWVVQPNQEVAAGNLAVYFRLEDVTFEQVFEARMANEPAIARLAALRRTDAELDAIVAARAAMDAPATPAAFLAADTHFHALIATAAHNVLLSFQMTPTMSLLEEPRLAVVTGDGSATSQAEHGRIVAAIRAQDGDAAEQAMRDHIASFARRGVATLESQKEPER